MARKKLFSQLQSAQPGDEAPEVEVDGAQVASYSMQAASDVYLVVRSGVLVSKMEQHPEAGPLLDPAGSLLDFGTKDLLSRVDATVLRPDAMTEEVRKFAEEAFELGCRNVCLYPSMLHVVRDIWPGPATVISFPHGANSTRGKRAEMRAAIEDGAGEIDLVANQRYIYGQEWASMEEELRELHAAAEGKHLKVILESGGMPLPLVREATKVVAASGCEWVKTSTGMTDIGATAEAVAQMRESEPEIGIKASGGIRSRLVAGEMQRAGANIFGISDPRCLLA